ncbi:MAG: hypothetical protein HOQ28_09040 [Thermoleophilia bacterium]|nr:hypothetical protein [Thermoleophilia bacterium]
MDAVPAIGPEHDGIVARDHGQTMESAPRAGGVGDRCNGGAVSGEDAADSVSRIRAEGNGACLVHRGAERANGREGAAGVRHYLQAPVSVEERALTAARKLAVEARVPRVIQVGMARDACVEGSLDDLLDLSSDTREDPGAADPKRGLERNNAGVVNRSNVGREPAEALARGRHHGDRKHRRRHYAV